MKKTNKEEIEKPGSAMIPVLLDPRIVDATRKLTPLSFVRRIKLITPGNWFTRTFWKYIKLDTSGMDKKLKSNADILNARKKTIADAVKYVERSKKIKRNTLLKKLRW